jgi:Icc-related predicted phosphoesterase
VEKEKPLYLFCGHIHETAGMSDRLGTTQCFNVGKEGYTIIV